jgi:predicted RNase H-related nuclease YkuK (DUF458 family)
MDINTALWFDGSGNNIQFSDVLENVAMRRHTHEVHVGGDSQPYYDYVVFAVTICLYLPGRGAIYYVIRKKTGNKAYKNLGLRLQHESELSLLVAAQVRESLAITNITIHADLSPNPINKSFKYVKPIQSFVQSMGFRCIVKPDSWAAWVADKHAK